MSTSLSPDCNELKTKYDNCFNAWYTQKYLKGITTNECDPLFQEYKSCVWVRALFCPLNISLFGLEKYSGKEN